MQAPEKPFPFPLPFPPTFPLPCTPAHLSMSFSMFSRMAALHARWQISVMSAPEKPCVNLTRVSKSTSGAMGDLRSTDLQGDRSGGGGGEI